jgi:class 3 adenylate cyclase/DNA polymerase III delta prime subunit
MKRRRTPQRVLVTVLFTDIVGSTELAARMGDSGWRKLLFEHYALVRRELRRFGGVEIDTAGDGFVARFANPTKAVLCAQAAVHQVRTLGISIRAGIHTGEADVTRTGVSGIAIHIGARVVARARADEVLVSSTTKELVTGGSLLFEDWGMHELKGVPGRWHIFRAVDTSQSAADRLPSPVSRAVPHKDRDVRAAPAAAWLELATAPVFVDRTAEFAVSLHAWESARDGRRALLLIHGEPGIGKTTLAAHVARRLRDEENALLLYGRWDEEAIASYQGFGEALGDYVRSVPLNVLAEKLGNDAGELSRLVPEIARRTPGLEVPAPVDAEAERFRLFEAVDSWIAEITSARPMFLVLDDIHWADRSSLLLALHLLRSSRSGGLLIAGVYRDSDLAGSELERSLGSLIRDTTNYRVSLEGLSQDHVAELVDQMTASTQEPGQHGGLARRLEQETAGNPFFVREMVLHIQEAGALADASGKNATGEALETPDAVRDVIRWRLNRLPENVSAALTMGSVVGQNFEAGVVASASEADEELLVALLERAIEAGLIAELPDRPGQYAFTHAVVRRTLLQGLSQARQAWMHRRIGEAFEDRVHQRGEPVSPALLAYHFAAAASTGTVDPAIRYSRLAGSAAAHDVAYDSALAHRRVAMSLQESYRSQDRELRCELLLELAEALDQAGEYGPRDQTLDESAQLARQLDRTDLFIRAALAYGGVLPSQVWPDAHAAQLIQEALERAGDQETPTRALLLARLAHWLHYAAPYESRLGLSDQAVEIARGTDDRRNLAAVLAYRSGALHGPGDVADEIVAGVEIIDLGHEVHDDQIVLQGMRVRLGALLEEGSIEEARAAAQALGELATRVRHPEYLRLAKTWEVLEAVVGGRLEQAEGLAGDLHERLRQIGHPLADLIYYGELLSIRWLQGRSGEIRPAFEMLLEQEPGSVTWAGVVAWLSAEMGESERVEEVRRRLGTQRVAAIEPNYLWWGTMLAFTNATVLVPDPKWADLLYRMMLPYAEHNCTLGLVSFNGAVSHHLGALAHILGMHDEACRYFEQALERHRSMTALPFVALTELSYSALLRSSEDEAERARGDEMRDAAIRMAGELGARLIQARDSLNSRHS